MLLEVRELVAGYGTVVVLHQISVSLQRNEVICIIGPNGAGKSTVLRAVAGQIPCLGGALLFEGKEIASLSLGQRAARGLLFIPQGDNVFPNLSVQENLEISGAMIGDRRLLKRNMEEVFERFPMIRERRHRPARELSGGQRQILALSRILVMRPKAVLLDEPSLGLAPVVVEDIFHEIQEMNRIGVSFLLVEQNARKGLSVSHRGYVLELGRNRLTGSGEELLHNSDVKRLYLGG